MEKLYKEDSTKHISPREFTRLRAGTYCGSTEYSTQLLRELIANALDEHNIGHGNVIKIKVNEATHEYMVSDSGQGFIVGAPRDNGETMLSECFAVINTSGKYDDSDDSVYGGSALGLNGIGMKLVCYLSSQSVVSTSDGSGKRETIYYKDGLFEKREYTDEEKGIRGTWVKYIPDPQFFQHQEANMTDIEQLCEYLAALCPTLTIQIDTVNVQGDGMTQYFHSENGLNDLANKLVGKNEIVSNRFVTKRISGNDLIDICLTYISDYSEKVIPFVNYGLTEKGVHLTALRTNLTKAINKFANDKSLFKKGEGNLTGTELSEGLVLIFNVKAKDVAYDAQNKERVVNIDKTLINEVINEEFTDWLYANEKDAKIIIEKALQARRAREAAKKAREAVRKPKEKGLKAKMQISSKFIDCTNKNPVDRSLLLVEGLSAGSAAVEARDAKRDAIYMLRGKVISPLKTELSKILANQEMSDIIRVIGAGFGNDFDVSKMNFDKIVITSDMDADGLDISLLLTTFFFTYMRPLVETGKLYHAVTPLYIVRRKGEELYMYTEKEMDDFKAKTTGTYEVLRAKGLGELNAEDLKKVCFENERYKRITVSDAEATTELLEILQGKAVEPRKQFIYDNAHELGFHFD